MAYWQTVSKDHRDSAISVVRDVVTAYRQSGDKTSTALQLMAPDLTLQPRRVRRLFEDDRNPAVDLDEYTRILLGAARVLRRIADRIRERADRWEAHADILELRGRQLHLWGGEDKKCNTGGSDRSFSRAA